jgi:hypothetical protein
VGYFGWIQGIGWEAQVRIPLKKFEKVCFLGCGVICLACARLSVGLPRTAKNKYIK